MALGGIRPERAGNRRPFDHPGLQGEERKEPLGRPGNPEGDAIPEQGESSEHPDQEGTIRPRQVLEPQHEPPGSWRPTTLSRHKV
jgi:hypothetical protein